MNRWVQEVQHLCTDLGVKSGLQNGALLIEQKQTLLRLSSFQDHYLIAIGIKIKENEAQWVGFATIARAELPQFLRDTL